jgi:hypothetical protein
VILSGYKYAHQHIHVNFAYEYVLFVGDSVFIACARERERASWREWGFVYAMDTNVGYVYMRANGGLGKLFCWCYIERKSENLDGASGEIIPYA